MKRVLFPLISALTLSTAVNAGISDELHKKCLEARDYAGCVTTNKNLSHKKDKEIIGIGIRLFLNSDTAELTIQSVINDSPAASADIQPNDVIIKIDGKSTKGMGITEAVSIIKGPKDKPIKLALLLFAFGFYVRYPSAEELRNKKLCGIAMGGNREASNKAYEKLFKMGVDSVGYYCQYFE